MENPDLLDHLIKDWQLERPDLDASPMAVVGRIIHLGGLMKNRANEALKDYDIHYTDLDVLATLRRSGKPYRMIPTQLSQLVLLSSGAMTASLNRLEKKGLLNRTSDANDGRVKAVVLSKDGKKIIDNAIQTRFEEAADSIANLNKRETEQLAKLLKKLTRDVKDS